MTDLPAQFWWWIARATGIVAWAMATAAVAWGLALSGRLGRRWRLPPWLLDLHRYLGTLTVAFLAVHIAALVADSYVTFGAREILVPMGSAWRPGAVTWGVLAMYGIVVVQATSWGMRFLPRKVWHGIHCSSYLVFVAATVHGALSGADRDNPWLRALAAFGVTLVVVLTVLRVFGRRAEPDTATRIAAAKARVAARKALADLPPPTDADRLGAPPPAGPQAAPGKAPAAPTPVATPVAASPPESAILGR